MKLMKVKKNIKRKDEIKRNRKVLTNVVLSFK